MANTNTVKLSEAARRLPNELKRMGWSYRRLEREAKLANGYASMLARGKRQPSARIAGRIERLLGKRMLAILWTDVVVSQ